MQSPSGIRHSVVNWNDAWMEIAETGLVASTLEGHQSSLFKKHLSFIDACKNMDAPTMSRAFQLQSVTEIFNMAKLRKSWDHQAATIIEGIFALDYYLEKLQHTLWAGMFICQFGKFWYAFLPLLAFFMKLPFLVSTWPNLANFGMPLLAYL